MYTSYNISAAPSPSLIAFDVLVNNAPITQYKHNNKTFVEGRNNSNYSIRVKNNNSVQVLAVISVDGLCINDGKPASETSKGWIINGNSELIIPGWLVNAEAAAKFKFSTKDKSYAEKSVNDTSNVGVIGCMLFEQKNTIHYRANDYILSPWNTYTPKPYYISDDTLYGSGLGCSDYTIPVGASCINNYSGTLTRSATKSADANNSPLGTAFGSKTDFKTTESTFERGMLIHTFVLYYDSRKNLEKLGVQFEKKTVTEQKPVPNPFPASSTYCVPPAGWR
jgi:hypothetical protein